MLIFHVLMNLYFLIKLLLKSEGMAGGLTLGNQTLLTRPQAEKIIYINKISAHAELDNGL